MVTYILNIFNKNGYSVMVPRANP